MSVTRTDVIAFLCIELAKHEPIARGPVPEWPNGVDWNDAPQELQDQYLRRSRAGNVADRLKTVLGHLRKIWPEQFPTKKGS